jgi:ABC-type sugar transport system permease subunit
MDVLREKESKKATYIQWLKVYRRKNLLKALLLMLPFLVLFVLFSVTPIVQGIMLSVYRTIAWKEIYVGFRNYIDLFTRDEVFRITVMNTLRYAGFSALSMGFALFLGWILNTLIVKPPSFKKVFQASILVPMVISWISLGMAWNWFFAMPFTKGWKNPLTDPNAAPWIVASLIMWSSLGYNSILMMASLRTIPREYYEAALIDGASGTQMFIYITLPLVKNLLAFMAVTGAIGAFAVFDQIATLTGGGPGWSTASMAWYMQRQVFYSLNYGYAATIAITLMSFVFILSLVQYRLIYKRFV